MVRSKIFTNQAYHVNFNIKNNADAMMYNVDMLYKHIYLLFQIDIRNNVKTTLYMSREYHMPLSDVFNLPYWLFEFYVDEISHNQKEEEKQRKAEQKEYDKMQSSTNVNSMMRNMQANMGKGMPSMSSMSNGAFPKVSLPKF